MKFCSVNEDAAVLFIPPEELGEGFALTAQSAAALARRAMSGAGMDAKGDLRVEAYETGAGVMLFIRKRAPRVYRFGGLEPLLRAVCALGDPGITATVTELDGGWYITSREGSGMLPEFGGELQKSEYAAAHLAEHGKIVWNDRKTGDLRAYFV